MKKYIETVVDFGRQST